MARSTAPSSAGTSHRLVRLIRLARSHGVRRALYRVASRLANERWWKRWFRFVVVEVYSAPVSELKHSRSVPRLFTVKRAKQEDLRALEAYFGDARRVGNRCRRGDVCAMTLSNGEVGAAVWFTAGPNDYREDWEALRCVVRFPAGVAWTFDGKGTKLGAWGALMMRLPKYLGELAAKEVYTLIDYDNRESIDGHLSLGYRRAGVLVHLRFPGIMLTMCKADRGKWRRLPGRIGSLEFHGEVGP